MRIVITGATGLLGRNLLLELFKRHWTAAEPIEVVALGRDGTTLPLAERLNAIADSEGPDYLGLPADASGAWRQYWRRSVVAMPFDLERDDLALSVDRLATLRRSSIDLFIHAAGSTDLRPGADVQSRVQRVNLEGTRRLIALLRRLPVVRLAYVGSAYAVGMPAGEQPDSLSDFRNPYERTKSQAEAMIAAFADAHGLPCTILRPAALCGRLLEQPLGSTCKFDTIYGWAAFFFREKRRLVAGSATRGRGTVEMPVRIVASPQAALNIVPVDYAAKTLLDACASECGFSVLPVVNSQSTPIRQMIGWVFEFLAVNGYQIVQEEPADKNDLESRYYRSIGRTLAPYMTGEPPRFDVSRLEDLERRTGGRCPRIDGASFARLLDHASERSFGLVD